MSIIQLQHEAKPKIRDLGLGFGIAFSHFHETLGHSYIQVYDQMEADSHEGAKALAHARIEQHRSMQFGVYDPAIHNVTNVIGHGSARQKADYHGSMRAWASLPTVCNLQGCGKPLTTEVFLPHIDYQRPPFGPGVTYTYVLHFLNEGKGIPGDYELGACCLEHAIQLAHAIIDEVLETLSTQAFDYHWQAKI